MKNYILKTIFSVLCILLWPACGSKGTNQKAGIVDKAKKNLAFTVEAAPEWTALFKRDSGWFGGDGIFAIPLNGKDELSTGSTPENLFVFSDTMVGEIKNDSLQPGFKMVNNSVAYLKGEKPIAKNMGFKVASGDGEVSAVFIPNTPNAKPEAHEYYWLGDGFVNSANGNTYIFAYRVVNHTEEGVFPFEIVGNALIIIPKGSQFPFKDHRQVDIPYFIGMNESGNFLSFGAGILANTREADVPHPDGYVYVYGIGMPGKPLIVSRFRPEETEDFSAWKFWDGKGWSTGMGSIHNIVDGLSNELSVSALPNGQFALVYQANTISPVTAMRIGESPVGPFGPQQELWDATEDFEEPEFYAYNAKAHPSISQPGELLISYNMNAQNFFTQIASHPHLYRPRFIRLKFK